MSVRSSMNIKALVDRLGQPVTLRKVSYGAYNTATGTVASTTNTDYTVNCYMADYSLSELNNDSIVFGDRKALLPAYATNGNALPEPDEEDKIVGLGDTVRVVSVQKIYHADTLVCYICQVRE